MNHYRVPEFKKREHINLTMRKDVWEALRDLCEVRGIKYSRFIEELVVEELEGNSVFKFRE